MMKKGLLGFLMVLMLVLVTACGGGNDSGTTGDDTANNDDTSPFAQYRAGEVVQIMETGTYYMSMTAYAAGTSMNMRMAADGDKYSMDVSGMGVPMRMLYLDGTAYYINDDNETYMSLGEAETPDMEDSGMLDYSDIEFGSDGEGTIAALAGTDDNSYPYEEFSVSESGESYSIRYYYDGDTFYAMEMRVGDELFATYVIDDFSADIPDGFLELPSGYTQVSDMMQLF